MRGSIDSPNPDPTPDPCAPAQSAKLKLLIDSVLEAKPDLIQDLREDLLVSTMRDSSIPSLLAAFLFSKGYHAVATYRISHEIYECVCGVASWGRGRSKRVRVVCFMGLTIRSLTLTHTHRQGRESLARYLQSLNSELFGADIHPACTIGRVRAVGAM